MNEPTIKFDETLIGPRLFCEYCCQQKVLSPCYFCQCATRNEINNCRGCGGIYMFCEGEYEICIELDKERFLLYLNEIIAKQETSAYFWRNQIRKLPIEIKQLTHLQLLSIRGDQLKELPREIGQLTNLQRLFIRYTRLGELPEEIGQLTNLQILNLELNELRKLPAEIGQLTNLKILQLGSNKLRELPEEIKNLTNLQELFIDCDELNPNTLNMLKKALPNTKIESPHPQQILD